MNRLPWLVILMVSYVVTGSVISKYEILISDQSSLVVYMPMLMGTAGNTGSQAATLVIRGIATGEILTKDVFRDVYKRQGLFNVPMGSYKNPLICDEKNLRAVSDKLQRVTIVCGDYRKSADFIDEKTFVYFDPPYRPITDTASFTAYTCLLYTSLLMRLRISR